MKSSFLMVLAGVLLMAGSGCAGHCGGTCYNEPYVTTSSFDFFYEGDFFNFTSSESYFWSTHLADAFISFEGIDFGGVIRIRIYDAFNMKIFDEIFIGNGGMLRAKTISDLGFPGTWEVQIDSTQVDGFVSVILD
ncbi:MAG: hypothetical protein AAEJ04_00235 [Planctomycetota bacterium]